MAVERSGVELSKDIDLGDVTVQAIAHWDINETVVSAERNSWLRSLLR